VDGFAVGDPEIVFKFPHPDLQKAAEMDGRPFTFAGLWENWKGPESGEWVRTCTIITGEPRRSIPVCR
jgi:putative SOS response-associated peptidase YedK